MRAYNICAVINVTEQVLLEELSAFRSWLEVGLSCLLTVFVLCAVGA